MPGKKIDITQGLWLGGTFPTPQDPGKDPNELWRGMIAANMSRATSPVSVYAPFGCSLPEMSSIAASEFQPSGKSLQEIRQEVVSALESEDYDWRSINGIAQETHLPRFEVEEMLKRLIKEGLIVRAPYLDKKGNKIYTTVKHYRKTIGFVGRLISTLTNRII